MSERIAGSRVKESKKITILGLGALRKETIDEGVKRSFVLAGPASGDSNISNLTPSSVDLHFLQTAFALL